MFLFEGKCILYSKFQYCNEVRSEELSVQNYTTRNKKRNTFKDKFIVLKIDATGSLSL